MRLRYGAPVSGVWRDDAGIRVAIDGSPCTLAADVLIGADGIHSTVRALGFGAEEEYLRPLGMRAAAFIVTEPLLNARFRNRFVLTDSIDRVAGLYSLRSDEVAVFMVYRESTHALGYLRPGSPRSGCAANSQDSATRSTGFSNCARNIRTTILSRRLSYRAGRREGPFSWGTPAGPCRSSRVKAAHLPSPVPPSSGTSSDP
ncbi:uncharacterized protein Rv1260/MT1298 [Arthrobacter sp. Hiyo8]|nr:uncharacterized protein Rv1260/MT1298 [Arthrobacter sp. Hiyo8]